ncbi:MAG: tRNA lysidine(34) synthetase TilS [Ruminococcus sp.]
MNTKDIFIEKMVQFITEENLLSHSEKICCALSGGADSVALLLAMLDVRDHFGTEVSAVHVNHCLRGAESDRDEEFCRSLCEKLGVTLHVHRCDVEAFRESHGGSVETAARQCRYDAFEKEEGVIATAHTASDNMETVIQRLARGTGLHGLCGIPVKRDRFIRPILFAPRQEIEEFLERKGETFVTDSTNNSDDYTRNKIRHSIVPLLQELNPSAEKNVLSMCRTLRIDDAFFDEQCSRAFEEHYKEPFCLSRICEIPKAVRVRCEARLLEMCGISADSRKLADMEKIVQTGGRCHLSGKFDCFVSKNELIIKQAEKMDSIPNEILISEGKYSIYPNVYFCMKIITEINEINTYIINREFTNRLLDYDKIKGCIKLRGRRAGDRMKLAGRGFTVSIKKRIQETVPLRMRHTLHFLEDEEGTIFAQGIGIAERVKPLPNETKRLMAVWVEDENTCQPERVNST